MLTTAIKMKTLNGVLCQVTFLSLCGRRSNARTRGEPGNKAKEYGCLGSTQLQSQFLVGILKNTIVDDEFGRY